MSEDSGRIFIVRYTSEAHTKILRYGRKNFRACEEVQQDGGFRG